MLPSGATRVSASGSQLAVVGAAAAKVHESPQVDVPGLAAAAVEGRVRRQRDHLLGDPAGRVGGDLGRVGSATCRRRGVRADQHAAARRAPSTGLVTSSPTRSSTVRRSVSSLGAVGRHRLQQRPLAAGSSRSAPARSSTSPCRRPRRCPARWPAARHPRAATSKTSAPIGSTAPRPPGRPARRPAAGRAHRSPGRCSRCRHPTVDDLQIVGGDQQQPGPLGEQLVLEPGRGVRTRREQRRSAVRRAGVARAASRGSAAARRPASSSPAGRGRSGSTSSIRSRIAIAYAAPLGIRTLSSSTRQPPNSLRTRSKPMIGARTAPRRQPGRLRRASPERADHAVGGQHARRRARRCSP